MNTNTSKLAELIELWAQAQCGKMFDLGAQYPNGYVVYLDDGSFFHLLLDRPARPESPGHQPKRGGWAPAIARSKQ